ncbi:MAG: hypothetical protein Q9162_000028 [Coniocarpon cinnabarinum]
MSQPTTVKLNDGNAMPLVGFGLWKVPPEAAPDQVYNAIKTGYRLFDGAHVYGNEKEVGQGIQRAIKDGLVKREDLFIVTKLWNYFHEKERVEPILRRQLKDLQLDYIDLYIIHFPVALKYQDPDQKALDWDDEKGGVTTSKAPLDETWHAMEAVKEKGLTKSIGVSNYNGALIMDLLRYCKIPPATLQIEHHPYLTQPNLVKICQDNGITITAYSSFGPSSYVEMDFKTAKENPLLMENAVVKKASEAHNKTPAQVLLRWATQRGISVIPKSNQQTRLQQNLDVTQWNLTDTELKEISALNKNLRFNDPIDMGFFLPIFH